KCSLHPIVVYRQALDSLGGGTEIDAIFSKCIRVELIVAQRRLRMKSVLERSSKPELLKVRGCSIRIQLGQEVLSLLRRKLPPTRGDLLVQSAGFACRNGSHDAIGAMCQIAFIRVSRSEFSPDGTSFLPHAQLIQAASDTTQSQRGILSGSKQLAVDIERNVRMIRFLEIGVTKRGGQWI